MPVKGDTSLKGPIASYCPAMEYVSLNGLDHDLEPLVPLVEGIPRADFLVAADMDNMIDASRVEELLRAHAVVHELIIEMEASYFKLVSPSTQCVRTLRIPFEDTAVRILADPDVMRSVIACRMHADFLFTQDEAVEPAPAPALKSLTLIFPDWWDGGLFMEDNLKPWACPVLDTLHIACAMAALRKDAGILQLQPSEIAPALRNVFGFSQDRPLPRLILLNFELEQSTDASVLFDIVKELEVTTDMDWPHNPPWPHVTLNPI